MTAMTYIDAGCEMRTLSTGRVIAVGIHSYSSNARPDGTEMTRSEYLALPQLTGDETREAWVLVDARLRQHRESRKAVASC